MEQHSLHQHFAAVLCCKFPQCRILCHRICQPIVLSVVDQRTVGLELPDLLCHFLFFSVGKQIQIQLIAKAACHCHSATGLKRRDSAGLVIRHGRHMRSHRRNRIEKGCAVLDTDAVNGIRVVAAPYLGRIVEHTCVKPSATAAASFNQHIRIPLCKTFQEIV